MNEPALTRPRSSFSSPSSPEGDYRKAAGASVEKPAAEAMNSSELARRMGVMPDGPGGWDEYHRFINDDVRPLLPRVGAHKAGPTKQARWIITVPQGREVARILGRPFS